MRLGVSLLHVVESQPPSIVYSMSIVLTVGEFAIFTSTLNE